MPIDMNVLNWLRGRIDVVDVETCTLLASHEQDAFFVDFVEDGVIAEVESSAEGVPVINLSRIVWRKEGGANGGTG